MGNDAGKPRTNRELLLILVEKVGGLRTRLRVIEGIVYGALLWGIAEIVRATWRATLG